MFPIAELDTRQQRRAYRRALTDPERHVRFKAQLYRRSGKPMRSKLVLTDGEIIGELPENEDDPDAPLWTAHIVLHDPNHQLRLDISNGRKNKLWFSHQLGIKVKVWVRDFPLPDGSKVGRWVTVPLFRGWIDEITEHGDFVEVDVIGKDGQHLDPWLFPESVTVRKNTRVHKAIRAIARLRGEHKLSLTVTHRRVPNDKTYAPGHEPMKAMQKLRSILDDFQLFFRGDGTLRLRKNSSQPVWRFTEGLDGVVLDYPERKLSLHDHANMVIVRGERPVKELTEVKTELSTHADSWELQIEVSDATGIAAGMTLIVGGKKDFGSYGQASTVVVASSYTTGLIIPLTAAIGLDHSQGAAVRYSALQRSDDKTKRVIGRAELPRQHSLSSGALTDGKRPMVLVIDNSDIHRRASAQAKAEKKINKMRHGITMETGFSCVPIYGLELGDTVLLAAGGIRQRHRIERLVIPVSLEGQMEINWSGERVPRLWRGLGRVASTVHQEKVWVPAKNKRRRKHGEGHYKDRWEFN